MLYSVILKTRDKLNQKLMLNVKSHKKSTIQSSNPMVKNGECDVMLWGCFSVSECQSQKKKKGSIREVYELKNFLKM